MDSDAQYMRCRQCGCWHIDQATDFVAPSAFTDGMTSEDQVVMKCTDCTHVDWVQIEQVPAATRQSAVGAPFFAEPGAEEILALIDARPPPSEHLEYRARLQALWRCNDRIRYSFDAAPPEGPEFLRNCEWLAGFGARHFADARFERCEDYLQFEMLRYLGRGRAALTSLESIFVGRARGERANALFHFWYALCQAGDKRVRIFPGNLELFELLPTS